MRGKKLLGIIMSLSLVFGMAAPSLNVQAKPVVPTTKYEVSVGTNYAPPNINKIIEKLKKEGKLQEKATPEEIQKALNEYLSKYDPANAKKAKTEVEQQKKMIKKAEKYRLKELSDKKINKMKENLAKSDVDYVQAEEWDGGMKVLKPLVILMEFPDYTHDMINKEDSERLFKDWSKEHYKEILFGAETYTGIGGSEEDYITMRKWYEEQSGQSHSLQGDVYGWYMAKENAKYYGEDANGSHNAHAKELVKEALANVAADPNIDLAEYDKEDRYDFDNDGDFNEPDGFIDHLIVIHASVGQEEGGGTLGDDSIWSHKSDVYDGFDENGDYIPHSFTDTQNRTWKAQEYNMDAQDGSVGVFCHEFGHNLGLPDEYDTIYSGEGAPVAGWAVMGGGAYNGIIGGTEPSGFSPWCKKFLQANLGGNWITGQEIDLEDITEAGVDFLLDQASTKGTNNDVVKINLPKKKSIVNVPTSGEYEYYSGKEDKSNKFMTINVDLKGKKKALLEFNAWYDIEKDYDYASVQVREAGTEDAFVAIQGNITTTENPQNQNPGHGITGKSEGWKAASFDLGNYLDKEIEIKINYFTDPATHGEGIYIDDITVDADGEVIVHDDVEGDGLFNLDGGFQKVTGYIFAPHYYLIEWRNQQGVDEGLKHARFLGETVSYDPGMVVWYADDFYSDNWVGIHPGKGFVGVVDADLNPVIFDRFGTLYYAPWNDVHMADAAFSLRRGTELDVSFYGGAIKVYQKNTFMHPFFDDVRDYNNPFIPDVGRDVPHFGLKFYVTGESKDRTVGKIHITKGN